MGNTHGLFLTAYNLTDFPFQLGIPAGTAANARGEAGGILKHGTAETLHVENSRNVMGRGSHHRLLIGPLEGSAVIRRVEHPHFQHAHLTDAIGDEGRHPGQGGHILCEHAAELSHFLFQAHFAQKIFCPLLGGQGRVQVLFHNTNSFSFFRQERT